MIDTGVLFIVDLEIYPNFFSFCGKFYGSKEFVTYEISARKNQRQALLDYLKYLQNSNAKMVGFNNLNFDYPILHKLLYNVHTFGYNEAYQKCQEIITSTENAHLISFRDRILPQIDLFKLCHFDNVMKRTSLKDLQFAMRLESVEDLPFSAGTVLTEEQMDTVLKYNCHDVEATERFLTICLPQLNMRQELLDQNVLTGDVLNFSDVKLGGEYLINLIGRQKCFSGSKPNQTLRQSVAFKDIILPSVIMRTEPYQEVVEWFKTQTIYIDSKDPAPSFKANLAGLDFHFGIGGIHASVASKKYEASETHTIIDLDVTSMYPSIAIANGFAPEHLGDIFKTAYKQLVDDRNHYAKGTSKNKILKLGSNGAFGNSDNPYSCFYDPKFPRQITVNGQLQILQLIETLAAIPELEIIQANTDGVTCYLPKVTEPLLKLWRDDWEQQTGLRLEEARYSKMWIRDCNNYMALYESGKVKLKGAYWWPKSLDDYEGNWNKNFSAMCIAKVNEQVLVNNWRAEDVLACCSDKFDFMLRYKAKGAQVYIGDKPMLKTTRYYVSVSGEPMKKVAPAKGPVGEYKRKNKVPDKIFDTVMATIGLGVWDERIHTKNKSKYTEVVTSIESGWLVKECNHASKFDWSDVDYDYYLEEIKKLEIV